MKFYVFFFIVFPTIVFSMELDSDLDGVIDKYDKCPNTPFDKLVEQDGCSREYKIFIAAGVGTSYDKYSNGNKYDSLTTHVDMRYIKNNFSITTSLSYYMSSEYTNDINTTQNLSHTEELADTYISLEYNQYIHNLYEMFLTYKFNLKLPTANKRIGTGKVDYGADITATKYIDKLSYFATLGYMNYTDTDETKYQDTKLASFGIGYVLTNNLFTSVSYTLQNSNLEEEGNIKRYSGFLYYDFGNNFYSNISYSYGKSDTTKYNSSIIMFGTSF